MCGIIGYLGTRKDVRQMLVRGLTRLEYRGYDSAGVCVQHTTSKQAENNTQEFSVVKASGQIGNLAQSLDLVRIAVLLVRWTDTAFPKATPGTKRAAAADRIAAFKSPAEVRLSKVASTPRADQKKFSNLLTRVSSESELPLNLLAGQKTLNDEEISASIMCVVSLDSTVEEVLDLAIQTFHAEQGIAVGAGKDKITFLVDGAEAAADRSAKVRDVISGDMCAFRMAVPDYEQVERGVATIERVDGEETFGGIAHTRWATHGEPSECNAHPHISNKGMVAIVHNGIIENRDELKEDLRELGYTFKSETDTEVLPVLLEHYILQGQTPTEAITSMMTKVRGAYGVAMLVRGDPRIYACRYGSPLCIGVTDLSGEFFVASEPSAFLSYTNQIIEIEDHEIVVCGEEGVDIVQVQFEVNEDNDHSVESPHVATPTTQAKDTVQRRVSKVNYNLEEVQKGKFPFFMLKEIHAQPTAVLNAISGKARDGGLETVGIDIPPRLSSISFVACGTSYHAGMIGGYIIENHVGIPVNCYYASEYINRACLLGSQDLVIAISQSGSTADTKIALERAKEAGCVVAGIVNVVGSQIARLAEQGMYLHAGPEIGVASTKAFSCQVAVINILAAFVSRSAAFRKEVMTSLMRVPDVLKSLLADETWMKHCEDAAALLDDKQHALFLGRGLDFPVALEGSLKLKEISYVHAEGIAAGEAKHGPIALIDENMPVVFVVGAQGHKDGTADKRGKEVFEKILSNMEEIKSRKGRIICVTDMDPDSQIDAIAEHVIRVPYINNTVAPIIKVLPLQLIAYHAAVRRGLDPDKPKNLAKSVTVT